MSRLVILGITAFATVAASAALALREDSGPEVVPAVGVLSGSAANIIVQPDTPPGRRRTPWAAAAPAAVERWGRAKPAPEPPPAALVEAATPAPAPQAPPFPYRWIGDLVDAQGHRALLDGPQRSIGARVGDVIDGTWRVDRLEPTRLEVTWLPGVQSVVVSTRP